MSLPEPFVDIIELDRQLNEPVVQMQDLKARRLAGRVAQVYLTGPRGSNTPPTGGTPVALVA